jgi:hypothetical protein
MFGIFKKKHSDAETERFVLELAQVASDFEHGISALPKESAEIFMEQSLNSYLECKSEEKSYCASDFFINKFGGAMAEAMVNGNLPIGDAQAIFDMTEEFLSFKYPKYRTDVAVKLMSMWKTILNRMK